MLWAFAAVQPLLDVLGDTPEFFVARGNTRADILLLAFGLALLPPSAMFLLELTLLRLPRARWALHLLLVAGLTGVIALQVLGDVWPGGPAVPIALAAVAGVAGAWLYAGRGGVRSFLTVLTPAPAVFLAIFLLLSPVAELVLPQDDVSAASAEGGGAPVVMVVFDELAGGSLMDRRLQIDARRYPNFAELARDSTWYRNATTVDYATERAVPALLTGARAGGDSLPIASDHPRNLFTLLGGRYTLDVRETATELCPESLCGERARKEGGDRLRSLVDDLSVVSLRLLLPDDLADDLPSVDATFEGFRDQGGGAAASVRVRSGIPQSAFDDRPRQFSRFLSRIDDSGARPRLSFLHLAMPHWPWQYLPSGRQYATDTSRIPGIEGSSWVDDPYLAQQGYQRYLLQLEYVDRLIGRLLTRLREQGLYDRALLVVTADHGVSFRAGTPRRYATRRNLPDIASVPLFIKGPGQRQGWVDDSPVQTIDVVPTIVDLLDVSSD